MGTASARRRKLLALAARSGATNSLTGFKHVGARPRNAEIRRWCYASQAFLLYGRGRVGSPSAAAESGLNDATRAANVGPHLQTGAPASGFDW